MKGNKGDYGEMETIITNSCNCEAQADWLGMKESIDLGTGRNVTIGQLPSTGSTVCPKRRKVLDVWSQFATYVEDNGEVRVKCMICGKSYAHGSSSHGTKNMRRHMEGCPKRTITSSVDQMMMDCDTKLRRLKISQEIYREKMVIGIIKHNYPYSIVEHERIRDVHMYLNHEVKHYTRNPVKADCLKIYYREKERKKLALERVSGRICLTSDIWSSCTTDGCISLMAHYVDENWELQSRILNFCHIPSPHSGALLLDIVYDFLKDWRIEKKVFSLTLDNAIQEGLKVSSMALHKIRESVKYVKGSEAKRMKFGELVKQIGVISSKGLRMDVPTRWNSTYLMLEKWDRGERICKFLQPFYEITTLFSGSQYPTANLYLRNVWRIQVRLYEEMENEDEVLSTMASQIKGKFDKYWDSYTVVLAIAAILDPRFKFEFVEFCYKKVDGPVVATRKLELVQQELYRLFAAYESLSGHEVPTGDDCGQASNPHIIGDDICEFDYYKSDFSATKKSELDTYLGEARFDRIKFCNLDVLDHWKKNSDRYPILSMMARDVMSIPITTVASESSFSIGSKVLSKYRSSLLPENAESLICTRIWISGYEVKEDEIDDAQLVVPLSQGRGKEIA
ncbi:zinc finger BED domain-containing protein RICESLEEPER 2-like [Pistacia vera]|uniref:zinc finger BED domain-containing protein RICESLEEPER 2-like n=1 Tax=Pistacia vera TaxID=55513 RepID=UPI0012637B9C|nr:zinc finger BED domain-containing protein RICESLEEPER 2-like [Pistacia vera]